MRWGAVGAVRRFANERARWFALRAAADAAAATGVHPMDVLGRCRTKRIARARTLAYWLAYETSDCSWPELAHAFSRNHSTLIKAVQPFARALQERDPDALRLLGRLPIKTLREISELFSMEEAA